MKMIYAAAIPRMAMTKLTDKSDGDLQIAGTRRLTATEFQGLAGMLSSYQKPLFYYLSRCLNS